MTLIEKINLLNNSVKGLHSSYAVIEFFNNNHVCFSFIFNSREAIFLDEEFIITHKELEDNIDLFKEEYIKKTLENLSLLQKNENMQKFIDILHNHYSINTAKLVLKYIKNDT